MRLIATRLRRPGFVPQGLFEPPDAQARAVAGLKRDVNAKVGRFALRSGATLPLRHRGGLGCSQVLLGVHAFRWRHFPQEKRLETHAFAVIRAGESSRLRHKNFGKGEAPQRIVSFRQVCKT